MELGGRLRRGEKEGKKSKSNGGRESESKTQNRSIASKARVGRGTCGEHRRARSDVWIGRGTDRPRKCRPRPRGDERSWADDSSRIGKGKGNV